MRESALRDLYFLTKYILGFWWLCWEPHKEFCEEIQRDVNLSLFLLPRGHCKTQCFNTGHTLQCYLKNPSEPIGIFCDIQKRASWKLRPLRSQLERNETLKELFPDLLYQNPQKQSPMWNQEEIILPGHDGRQEPSIGVYGLDNQPTSLHFPRIKGDDLVTDKTVTTADQIKKNKDQFGLMRSSILQSGGNIQVCGTVYDDGDLHRLLENSGQYRVYKKPAEKEEIDTDGIKRRKILWPVQYSAKVLDEIKRDPSVGVYIYSCNYLLDPAPEDENSYFQLGWFPRYKFLPRQLKFYAAADLAISEKEEACETAINVWGMDTEGDSFWVECVKGHFDGLAIVDAIIDVQARFRPGLFTIEGENIQRAIMPFLKKAMRERQIFVNVEIKNPQRDKVARARGFQARAKEGAIWLPEKGVNQPPWLFDVEYQIRRFPRANLKDIIDSASLLAEQLDKQWRQPTEAEIKQAAEEEYVALDKRIGM